jgi:hypothetical protein
VPGVKWNARFRISLLRKGKIAASSAAVATLVDLSVEHPGLAGAGPAVAASGKPVR